MTKIQLDLSEKANNILEKYVFYNGESKKASAINKIIESYNIQDDFNEWVKKECE